MRQYYFSWIRGMQVPCRFYVRKYRGNLLIRVLNREINVYWPLKIRVEVY